MTYCAYATKKQKLRRSSAQPNRPVTQLTLITQKILYSYLFLFHVEHQRLYVVAERQLKLLGLFHFSERQGP